MRAGLLADLTVLGGDLMVAPATTIPAMKVPCTVVGGRVVYEAGPAAAPRERTIEIR